MAKPQPLDLATLEDGLKLDRQLCFAVYSLSQAFNRVYKPGLDQVGLTYPQYLVLLVLWEQDDQMMKHIGERLHLDSGTLTPLLKRLEAAGIVRRQRDPEDERQVRIILTPKGHSLKEQAAKARHNVVCASGRSAQEIQALRDELIRLRDSLNSFLE
ncbi:MarR family transcriptional regulator [Microvirga sp. BSC39]|uniref:MarR family winged helix-turn-helix transcriptional regulator n=1 Tax=Microvirga sp. BSC39 TaxID=1549810 RepID=UPI0004E95447|nr:MarR family transcriptional regulator [Microvirga sp. BSC39]KFG70866.1 MarR family transcriptional regulator [Microvirga sp. BSC39]